MTLDEIRTLCLVVVMLGFLGLWVGADAGRRRLREIAGELALDREVHVKALRAVIDAEALDEAQATAFEALVETEEVL